MPLVAQSMHPTCVARFWDKDVPIYCYLARGRIAMAELLGEMQGSEPARPRRNFAGSN